MTDGDVDVVLLVAGRGNGEQRGDRPALNDLKILIDQAPFDVLRAAEVRFDPPAQLRESNHVRIRQRGCACRSGSIRSSWVPPVGAAWMASCLVPTVFATTSPSRTL